MVFPACDTPGGLERTKPRSPPGSGGCKEAADRRRTGRDEGWWGLGEGGVGVRRRDGEHEH